MWLYATMYIYMQLYACIPQDSRWGCHKVCAFSVHDGCSFPLHASVTHCTIATPSDRADSLDASDAYVNDPEKMTSATACAAPGSKGCSAYLITRPSGKKLRFVRSKCYWNKITQAFCPCPTHYWNFSALARVLGSSSGRHRCHGSESSVCFLTETPLSSFFMLFLSFLFFSTYFCFPDAFSVAIFTFHNEGNGTKTSGIQKHAAYPCDDVCQRSSLLCRCAEN